MITVKEALKIALSEELGESEQKAYNLITKHIDTKIRENFNGESVDVQLEGTYIANTSSPFSLRDFVSKPWRRDIVTKKWRKEYESGGWKIEDKETKDHYGRRTVHYTFSIDPSYYRDEKLNELLS
jgi:hypothetical protein